MLNIFFINKRFLLTSRFLKRAIFYCIFFFFIPQASAQFTITDNFRGGNSPDIIIGDMAKLTSGDEDPVNAGWLRLTTDATNQRGYAYVNKSFPSTLGVLIDFEYTMWRSTHDSHNGADGIGVFLFDAQYGPGNFELGAYGGSLGYANSTDSNPPSSGLRGGYLGIGFDAYGNFAAATEGKNGGANRESPNSIVFRGPTTNNAITNRTNRYLAGKTILNNGSIVEATAVGGNAAHDVIDYNTVSPTRPTQIQFYRRVQIEIEPTSSGLYDIHVRWATEFGGELTELMTYTTEDVPPALLKVGFAASTGGGFNNHEVRNLLVTTPGNLRIVKRANKDLLRSVHSAVGASNEIEYHIEVNNDTSFALEAIDFTDKLSDALGNPLAPGAFSITSITHSGFIANGTSLPTPSASAPISSGEFEGVLHLAANSVGSIRVRGVLNTMPLGNILTNTTTAFPTTIVDQDLMNNTSSVQTPVVSERSDLVISSTVGQACLSATDGNNFELVVSNIGNLNLQYGAAGNISNNLRVVAEFPAGAVASNFSHSGWTSSNTGNTYTFTRTSAGTLRSGASLPPISYTLNSSSGYTSQVEVKSGAEPIENTTNNTNSSSVNPVPVAPNFENTTIYYCFDAEAKPLEVAALEGHKLLWYLNQGGASSSIPFTPNTSLPGSTTYYVSQQAEGGCESPLAEITVIVFPDTQQGSISGNQEVCAGSIPALIASATPGTGAGSLSYRWEKSIDAGLTWAPIENASAASYQPAAVNTTTSFRRISLSADTASGAVCESGTTNTITITTKGCSLISNPMIYQKMKNLE